MWDEMADRQIKDILESIIDAFVAVDHEWRYTYINERALRRMLVTDLSTDT
jgi:PAS domain-containing protein